MAETSDPSTSLLATPSLGTRNKKCCSPRVRKVGSKGARLVCFWAYCVFFSLAVLSIQVRLGNLHAVRTWGSITCGISIILTPFAGLLGIVYFSRYNVMYACMWPMWCGRIANAIIFVILRLLPEAHHSWIYPGEVTAIVLYFLGLIAFVVTSVPFGLDQMPDASSDQITAFIHWYTWSALVGVATAQLLYVLPLCMRTSYTSVLLDFTSTLALTMTLCSIFLFRHWLIIEPKGNNPLKTIFKVLKFAVKHNVPIRRSAFTYWEPGMPSRINLGKAKYGGPFTNEEVEDVKTCLQMLLVISSISVAICSFTAYTTKWLTALHVMLRFHESTCHYELLALMLLSVFCVTLSLPVYDITIHPIVRKCIPSTLKRAGLAQIFSVFTSFSLLVTSIIWYTETSPEHCILISSNNFTQLPLDSRWTAMPLRLAKTIFLFFFFTAMLEFVCAQAPYNMKGLLLGLLPPITLLSSLLGVAVHFTWTFAYQRAENSGSMCGIWFYLFTTITAILGCVIWCVVTNWYKKRERDEPEMIRIFAENYYDH